MWEMRTNLKPASIVMGRDRFFLAMTLQHLHGVHTHQDGTYKYQRFNHVNDSLTAKIK